MNKDAIAKIEQLVAATTNIVPDTYYPAILYPDGMILSGLENFYEHPYRHRGSFATSRIQSFIRYVNEHRGDFTHVFIDDTNMKAEAAFDHYHKASNTAGWREHTAIITMEETPEWSALLNHARHNDYWFTQREFLDFMQDWSHALSFKDKDGDVVETNHVYQAVQKLEIKKTGKSIHEEGEFRASSSRLEELDIKGSEQSLPATMHMECKTHIGLESIVVDCRLMVLTNGDTVALGYRINALEKILDGSAKDFLDKLQECVDDIPIWMGRFQGNK